MVPQVLSGDDVRFLAQQPDAEVGSMLGQMTTLMQNINDLQQDTDDKVAKLESQGWFKRMTNTLLGKNKATKQEIQKNNDKVVTYISQSVAQLYQMNMINERIICSLGNRMNEVYMQVTSMYQEQLNMKAQISQIMAVQQQTLEAMGAFVSKLNEKIESVDNFHMLISEIQNGMYCDSSKLYNLCSILSQLDKRQMDDSRKMNLLRDTMERSGIITQEEFSVLQCLQEIVALPTEKIGLIYMELCNFRQSFPANLFADMIESYHFLSKMERMSKKKELIIQRVIDAYELDADAAFSVADIAESFFENKQACLVSLAIMPQIVTQEQADIPLHTNNNPSNTSFTNGYTANEYDYDKIDELWKTEEYETALALIRPAAENGNMNAQSDLGLAYQLGYGVAVNMSESLKWFLKAAQQGDESCMESVACIYAGIYDDCESLKNSKKAEEWFKKAEATATDEDDFFYWHYYDFLNDEGREKEALAVMKRGADNGSVISMVDLANVFYWGEDYGVPQNFNQAGKWFEKAADCGDNVAMMRMGEFCLSGLGNIPQDRKRAFQYLTKAIEGNDDLALAHLLLGKCYLNGWGTAESIGKAKEHFKKAANADSVEAMFWLGVAYREDGNGSEATKWLQKAADNDSVDALVTLGYMYLNGNAVKQKYQRAYEFFKKAANQGDADAQCAIGEMYYDGHHVQQNYAKAMEWFRKSMNQGNEDAKAWVGLLYFCGNGCKQNMNYGTQLIQEAANEGSEFAVGCLEGIEDGSDTSNNSALDFVKDVGKAALETMPGYNLGSGIAKGINRFLKK